MYIVDIQRRGLQMSILEPVLAQKFIDKTASHLEYNINIMNDKGIIIASKDTSRVGDFHEVAFSMLNGTIDTGIVNKNEKYLGTKPGVNLFVDYKSKHVGVICVTGDPENVSSFAGLVKISLEVMLEYELQMEGKRRRKNKTEQFLYYLLFEEGMNAKVAHKMADELELDKEILRVCIHIKHDSKNNNPKKIVKALTKAEGYSFHDIIAIARNDDIIMFKTVGGALLEAIKNSRYIVEEYYNAFIKEIAQEYNVDEISFIVGSLQNNIGKYKISYSHTQELGLQVKTPSGIHFFNDHVLDYYRSLVTIKAYDNVFNVYETLFNEEDKNQFVEMIQVLNENNYNVVYSAKVLYIHRNTLLFRLNKLKEMLNIDPIAKSEDREFLNELSYYFSQKQ